MAHGAPDWTRRVEVVIVEAQPGDEVVAGDAGTYTGTAQTYQEVASWTVSTGKVGELKEITILSTLYAKTQLKITIFDTVWETDWAPQGTIPLIFEDLRGAAAAVTKVECKSSDGTSITVDAVITGKEKTI